MSLPAIVIALFAALSPGAVIDPIVVDAVAQVDDRSAGDRAPRGLRLARERGLAASGAALA